MLVAFPKAAASARCVLSCAIPGKREAGRSARAGVCAARATAPAGKGRLLFSVGELELRARPSARTRGKTLSGFRARGGASTRPEHDDESARPARYARPGICGPVDRDPPSGAICSAQSRWSKPTPSPSTGGHEAAEPNRRSQGPRPCRASDRGSRCRGMGRGPSGRCPKRSASPRPDARRAQRRPPRSAKSPTLGHGVASRKREQQACRDREGSSARGVASRFVKARAAEVRESESAIEARSTQPHPEVKRQSPNAAPAPEGAEGRACRKTATHWKSYDRGELVSDRGAASEAARRARPGALPASVSAIATAEPLGARLCEQGRFGRGSSAVSKSAAAPRRHAR